MKKTVFTILSLILIGVVIASCAASRPRKRSSKPSPKRRRAAIEHSEHFHLLAESSNIQIYFKS